MKKNLFITFLFCVSQPIQTRFTTLSCGKQNKERRDCILYDYPSRAACDIKFPNRMTAEEYTQFNIDIAIGWLIMMIGILSISFTCCNIY